MHPVAGYGRNISPPSVRAIQIVHIPGNIVDLQNVLPFHTCEFVPVPQILYTRIIKFCGAEVRRIAIVGRQYIYPDNVYRKIITGILVDGLLRDGEPPSTSRSRG